MPLLTTPVAPPSAAATATAAGATANGTVPSAAAGAGAASSFEERALASLARLHESIGKAGGTAGVLGVAVASPLAFSWCPWLVAVLVVFLVGLTVELGPGLLLEQWGKSLDGRKARGHPRHREEQTQAQAPSASSRGAQRSAHPHSSEQQHQQPPPATPTSSSRSTAAAPRGNPAAAAAGTVEPLDPSRRDFSLFGSRIEVRDFRVVEGSYASYKVAVSCKGSSWSVWRRFSAFEDLREALVAAGSGHDHAHVPLLPPKTLFKNLSPRFLTKRAEQLQAFMRDIVRRRALCDTPALRSFLEAGPMASGEPSSSARVTVAPPQPSPTRTGSEEAEGLTMAAAVEPTTAEARAGAGAAAEAPAVPAVRAGVEEEDDDNEEVAVRTSRLSAACRPGDSGHCGTGPSSQGEGAEEEEEEEEEEEDEGDGDSDVDEEELRRSGERPALSTASTDDGADDEERVRRTAESILETMRELSAHSPSEWDTATTTPGADPSPQAMAAAAAGAGAGAAAVGTANPGAAGLRGGRAEPPASCEGMSLEDYQAFSLRFLHPTAFYDPGPGNTFRVRGRRYLHDGHKVPAGPPVGKLLLAYVFTVRPDAAGGREDHIASRGRMAAMLADLRRLRARDGRPPYNYVVNFQVPGDPPLSMVFVFALPRDKRPEADGNFWALFDRFVDFDEAGGGEPGVLPLSDFRNKRFKLIPSIVDGPSMIRWAVGNKPTILGQKLTQRYFRGPDYVEVDVDIASSAVASQIVSLCRGYARYLKVQMAIVLQGEDEARELPEVLVGTVGIDNLDIDAAADGPNEG